MTAQSNSRIPFNEDETQRKNLNFKYSLLNKQKYQTPITSVQSQGKEGSTNDAIQETIKSNICKPSLKQSSELINRSYISNSLLSFSLLYEREKERKKLLNRKLDNERSLSKLKEERQLKPYPQMSKVSKCLIKSKNKSFESPLYLKQDIITEKQTMNLKNLIQNENDKIEIGKSKVFNQKDFDNFIKENENLIQKKNIKIQKKQIEIEEELNSQSTPKLNKNNVRLIKTKRNSAITRDNSFTPSSSPYGSPRSQFHLKKKIAQCLQRLNTSFTPIINNRRNSSNSYKLNTSINSKKPNNIHSTCQIKISKSKSKSNTPHTHHQNSHHNTSNNSINKSVKSSSSTYIQSYKFKVKDRLLYQRGIINNKRLKQQSATKEIIIEQTESSNQYDLYPLNIRSNLSSQDAQTVITLNKKHKGLIESYFFQ